MEFWSFFCRWDSHLSYLLAGSFFLLTPELFLVPHKNKQLKHLARKRKLSGQAFHSQFKKEVLFYIYTNVVESCCSSSFCFYKDSISLFSYSKCSLDLYISKNSKILILAISIMVHKVDKILPLKSVRFST